MCSVPDAAPVYLTVSSTGPAAVSQAPYMGVYLLTKKLFNSFPVYEMLGGTNVIFVSESGFWQIDSELSTVGDIYYPNSNPTPPVPPVSGWRYWNGSEYTADNDLTVTARGMRLSVYLKLTQHY